jgi:hypothetical protein
MQYCIENGVKLEWLGNSDSFGNKRHIYKEKGSIACTVINNKITSISYINDDEEKEMQLIAAIYAHDIKIIAT